MKPTGERSSSDGPVAVQCQNCGLTVKVPVGGRRLCGCGTWLSATDAAPVAVPMSQPAPDAEPAGPGQRWPRIEGDLSAIERLNDGYRRIRKEMSKAIVGQANVLEELL